MHRYLPICAIAGALALFATAFGTAQAAPVVGLSAVAGDAAHSATSSTKPAGAVGARIAIGGGAGVVGDGYNEIGSGGR